MNRRTHRDTSAYFKAASYKAAQGQAIRYLVAALVTTLLCSAPVFADDDTGRAPWDTPFAADAASLLAAAQALDTDAGESIQLLARDESLSFDDQGRATRRTYLAYRILSAGAVEAWGSIDAPWSPWFEQRPEVRARVVTAEGTEYLLDPNTLSEMPAPQDEKVLGDRRMLRAALPAVSPGAVIEWQAEWHEHRPPFAAGNVFSFGFGTDLDTGRFSLRVEAPASLPLRFEQELLPELEPVRQEQDGRVSWTFVRQPAPAHAPLEFDMPLDAASVPRVTISTTPDWKSAAAEYAATVDRQLAEVDLDDAVDEALHQLETDSTRRQRIDALLAWMQERVRYTGLHFGEAAIVPHPPTAVLERRYGDCKDKATLLVGLLRAAGIEAHVALLRAGEWRDVSPDMPGLGLFNHAIVYVPDAAEADAATAGLWIDPTHRFARAGELPTGDQGRLALIAHPETRELVRLPVSTSADNRQVVEREVRLPDIGLANVTVRQTVYGSLALWQRTIFSIVNEEDIKAREKEYMEEQEEILSADFSDPLDLETPFSLEFETRQIFGMADLTEAVVLISAATPLESLPEWL